LPRTAEESPRTRISKALISVGGVGIKPEGLERRFEGPAHLSHICSAYQDGLPHISKRSALTEGLNPHGSEN
jgi:hypothetical protein